MRSAQVAGQWRGDTALTLPLFWRRSTVSPVFFGRFPRSSLHSFIPFPHLSPSLISHLASVDVKQNGPKVTSDPSTSVRLWLPLEEQSEQVFVAHYTHCPLSFHSYSPFCCKFNIGNPCQIHEIQMVLVLFSTSTFAEILVYFGTLYM